MKLCIIIPAYNEEKRIGATLEEYVRFFDEKASGGFNYEILVVINHSSDDTVGVVKKFQKKFPRISYMELDKKGKGLAITEGFRVALHNEFDFIGFVDADMATRPEEYYRILKNIGNFDGVIASRWKVGAIHNYSFKRRILSKGFNFAIRSFLFLSYWDTQCGAKIFKKNAVEKVVNDIYMTAWAFDINLLYLLGKRGFRIKEIATIWEDKDGSSVDAIRDTFKMFLAVMRLRLINSPFRIIVRAYDKLPNKFKIRIP